MGFGPAGSGRMSFSGRERNKFFYNDGGKRFVDLSYLSGLNSNKDGRVFAHADFDHDGDEDAVVISRNAPILQFFRNDIEGSNEFIGLRVHGDGEKSNVDAIGARVRIRCGERVFLRTISGGAGFATQKSRTLTIGLGDCKKPEKLVIDWPSGRQREFTTLRTRALFDVDEDGPLIGNAEYYQPSGMTAQEPVAEATGGGAKLLGALGTRVGTPLVYVSYWASWCASCKAAQPQVDRLAERYRDRIAFVGVSLEEKDTPEVVKEYEDEHQPAYPLLPLPEKRHQTAIRESLALFDGVEPAMPAAVVLDATTGEVVWQTLGVATVSDLERVLSLRGGETPADDSRRLATLWVVIAAALFMGWVVVVARLRKS